MHGRPSLIYLLVSLYLCISLRCSASKGNGIALFEIYKVVGLSVCFLHV